MHMWLGVHTGACAHREGCALKQVHLLEGCALRRVFTRGVGKVHSRVEHTELHQGLVASLGDPSEPHSPFLTAMFNNVMLVKSFNCLPGLASM